MKLMNSRGAGKQGHPALLLLRSSWILILCPACCAVNSSHYTWLKQISVQMCCPEKQHSGPPCCLPVVNIRNAQGNLDLKSAFLWAVLRPCHGQRSLPTQTSPPICESVPVIPLQHLAQKKNRNGAVLVCADHITIKVLQNQECGLKAGTPFDYSRHGSGLPWREEITKSVPVSREIAMFQKTHQISQFTVFT